MIQQLSILLKNQANGLALRLDGQVEGLTYSTVVPGGFGTVTFRVAERAAINMQVPLQAMYACDLTVADASANSLFEGILTDVKYHSDGGDSYFECEATGWQILLDNPYRNLVIERNLPWTNGNVAYDPTFTRNSVIAPTIGLGVGITPGIRFDVPTGVAITSGWRGSMQFILPVGSYLQNFLADVVYDTNRTAQFNLNIYSLDDSLTRTFIGTVFGAGSSAGSSINISMIAVSRGIYLELACATAGTTSANVFSIIQNIRVLGTRVGYAGSSSSEPVYGDEIVRDIVWKSQLLLDSSGIEPDTSYQVVEFSYQTSDTGRAALDAITAYYNKYWAVWEKKRLTWKAWTAQSAADWVVSKSVAQLDIDPSIVNAANVARIRYTDAAGIAVETDVTDPNQDNVYTLAGRTKTAIVDLGVVSTTAAATQVGAVFFPDHSYEVVGGTITLDAQTPCYSQTRGTNLPAYLIRSGDTVRIRDGESQRSIFETNSWNRATLFRITATDVDWDAQTVKITCDNAQASLDQLTARIQTNLSAKYGT